MTAIITIISTLLIIGMWLESGREDGDDRETEGREE